MVPNTTVRMQWAVGSAGLWSGDPVLLRLSLSSTVSKAFLSLHLPSLESSPKPPSALQILQFHFSNLVIVFFCFFFSALENYLWGEIQRFQVERKSLNYSPDVKEGKKNAESHLETRKAKQSEFCREGGQSSIYRPKERSESPCSSAWNLLPYLAFTPSWPSSCQLTHY